MKEFSVGFYKKLIIVILVLIFLAALFFSVFAFKAYLESQDSKRLNQQNTGIDGTQLSSGDDIKKLAEKAQSKKQELQGQKTQQDDKDETEFEENRRTGSDDSGYTASSYVEPEKVVYLTFEDGASANTEQILSILEENGVKATFFFNTSERKSSDEIIKTAFDNGNAVGISTSISGSLSEVYETAQDYGRDIDQSSIRLEHITGRKPDILRFPGGSNNSYMNLRKDEFVAEVKKRGLVYFDWNLCAEGNGHVKDLSSLVANATRIKTGTDRYIILMHDNGNVNTCAALRRVIQFYQNEGFEFMPLSSSVKPIVF
ncbi:MAG: polysaccharide deacetylase family protein [Eubacteriales bacterium]